MSRRAIIALKMGLHVLCLAPFIWLMRFCTSPGIFLNADPVKFIIHFTGDWAIYILIASLSIVFLRKLAAMPSLPIQVYRVTTIYALLWATLHMALYLCIYSGYDFVDAFAGFHTGHPGALIAEWNAVFPGIGDDFRKRPFLDVGLFAWIFLLVASISSQGLLRYLLPPNRWRSFFPLICAAAIAAVIHLLCFVAGRPTDAHGPEPSNCIYCPVSRGITSGSRSS